MQHGQTSDTSYPDYQTLTPKHRNRTGPTPYNWSKPTCRRCRHRPACQISGLIHPDTEAMSSPMSWSDAPNTYLTGSPCTITAQTACLLAFSDASMVPRRLPPHLQPWSTVVRNITRSSSYTETGAAAAAADPNTPAVQGHMFGDPAVIARALPVTTPQPYSAQTSTRHASPAVRRSSTGALPISAARTASPRPARAQSAPPTTSRGGNLRVSPVVQARMHPKLLTSPRSLQRRRPNPVQELQTSRLRTSFREVCVMRRELWVYA
jgi:hypothetical protein